MKFSSDYTFLLKDKKRKNESHLFMLKYIKHFLILKYLSAINNTPLMIRSSAVLGSSVLQGYNNSFQKCLFFLKTYHYTLYISKHLFIFEQRGGYQSAVASVLQAEIQTAVVLSLCSLHLDHKTFAFPVSQHIRGYSWTVL